MKSPLAWARGGNRARMEESSTTSRAWQGVPASSLPQGREQRGHTHARRRSRCKSVSPCVWRLNRMEPQEYVMGLSYTEVHVWLIVSQAFWAAGEELECTSLEGIWPHLWNAISCATLSIISWQGNSHVSDLNVLCCSKCHTQSGVLKEDAGPVGPALRCRSHIN